MISVDKPEYNVVLHKVGTGEQLNVSDVVEDFEGQILTNDITEAIKAKRYLEKPNISAVATIKHSNTYPFKEREKDEDIINEPFWGYF